MRCWAKQESIISPLPQINQLIPTAVVINPTNQGLILSMILVDAFKPKILVAEDFTGHDYSTYPTKVGTGSNNNPLVVSTHHCRDGKAPFFGEFQPAQPAQVNHPCSSQSCPLRVASSLTHSLDGSNCQTSQNSLHTLVKASCLLLRLPFVGQLPMFVTGTFNACCSATRIMEFEALSTVGGAANTPDTGGNN